MLLLLLACADADRKEPGDTQDTQVESAAPDTDDSSPRETGDSEHSTVDTSTWECGADALLDAVTLCYDHTRYPCELSTIGQRRGDWQCWPGHAFCPDPAVYCEEGEEGWAEVPLALPSDLRAVAEGVLTDPELVFTSPIDAGFTPTRTVTASSITEAYYAFYYDEVVAGEEVVLKDGTYTDCYIGFEGEGEPGRPLVLRAETPGGVTLDSCAIYMAGQYLVLSGFRFTGEMVYTPIALGYTDGPCDHCAVRDVTIDTVVPTAPQNRPYVQIYGSGSEVSDSTFIGKANTSAVITIDRAETGAPLGARIYRNAFLDRTNTVASPGTTNGFEVIRVGYSLDYHYPGYVVIEGNLFERCDGELETISVKSSYNVIRFNTLRDNAGQISIRAGFGNVVEGNYILGADKAWSGGIRTSGAGTLVVGNHVQDIVPYGSRWRYPLALVTGSEDPYEEYTPVFEGAVLLNRAISADYAFALDTGEDYPPTFYPPRENLYAWNLLLTGGSPDTLGYTFEDSLTGNTISDNWTDATLQASGFETREETSTVEGELSRCAAFEDEISGLSALDLLSGTLRDQAAETLVLGGADLYDAVPLLSEGDVGGP